MAEIEVRLGAVVGGGGELQFSAELDQDGRVWVLVYASPFAGRGGTLVRLSVASLDNLEAKIQEARRAVQTLTSRWGERR